MIVGHGSGLDNDGRFLEVLHHGIPHFDGGLDVDDLNTLWRRDVYRTGDEDNASAPSRGCFCNGIAHLAAGTVRDEADRIERFLSGTRSDQHGLAFEILHAVLRPDDSVGNDAGFGEPAGAFCSAGEQAFRGLYDDVTAAAQSLNVVTNRGMFPHVRVHRRSEHDCALECEIESGEEIVSQAVRELGQQIRSRGSDNENIVLLCDSNMLDRTGESLFGRTPGPESGDYLPAG